MGRGSKPAAPSRAVKHYIIFCSRDRESACSQLPPPWNSGAPTGHRLSLFLMRETFRIVVLSTPPTAPPVAPAVPQTPSNFLFPSAVTPAGSISSQLPVHVLSGASVSFLIAPGTLNPHPQVLVLEPLTRFCYAPLPLSPST